MTEEKKNETGKKKPFWKNWVERLDKSMAKKAKDKPCSCKETGKDKKDSCCN